MSVLTPRISALALLAAAAIATASTAIPQQTSKPAAAESDPYPLTTCPVSGKELNSKGGAVIQQYNGREIRFCCKGCPGKFTADPETYIAKIDKKIIERQGRFYPTTICVVSGEELGSDPDDIVDVVYNNRLVRMCCRGCAKKLKKDPAPYLKKLDAAVVKQQAEHYPLTECPVSGEALGSMGDPIVVMMNNRMVKLCCKGCVRSIKKDPGAVIAKVDAAWQAKHTGKGEAHGAGDGDGDRKGHGG